MLNNLYSFLSYAAVSYVAVYLLGTFKNYKY